MNTSPLNNVTRLLTPFFIGVVCGVLGWWLRGLTGQQAVGTAVPSEESRLAPTADASAAAAGRSRQPQAASSESPAATRARVNSTVTRMFTADLRDAVEMMEMIGSLTRLTDAEVKMAWEDLMGRDPRNTAGTSFASLYLWGRMHRMGENVPVPDKWGAQDFQGAIEAEQARRDRTHILARLRAGEELSETERRVVLADLLREDPLDAISLWCRVTKPAEYQREAESLGNALTNPETRAAIMAQLRAWQKGGDPGGATAALARNWIHEDPAAVERWLKDPAQADVREAVMTELITARAVANAADTWNWARSLSPQERQHALDLVAPRLAINDREAGMKLLSELQDPGERQQAIRGFAFGLAGDDYSGWLQWRETLSPADRDLANESAFPYWVNKDINKAVEWLGTRPAGEAKDLMVTSLVFYFAEQDPQTAAQWIRTISDADRRREAVTAALSNVGPEDLNRVKILVGAMED
jgi:hypothetical protein